MKKILINSCLILALIGCQDSSKDESSNQIPDTGSSKSSQGNVQNSNDKLKPEIIFEDREHSKSSNRPSQEYSYIPIGDKLTQEMAYRFLNMATFGATPELADELRTKGVVDWVDEQINLEYDYNKQSTLLKAMKWMQKVQPNYLNKYGVSTEIKLKKAGEPIDPPYSIKQILDKNEIRLVKYNTYDRNYLQSALMQNMLYDKAQLREKVAYALSQIIIASESVDRYFFYRATALAYYYDTLLKHAFDGYSELLYDVSLTPAMSVFMTYNGSRKTYTKNGTKVTPDENYGREIMQKFTIGLNKLSIDGMEYSDGVDFKQNYTQDDVNTMSRVFTGLNTRLSPTIHYGDAFNPIECKMDYHDSEEKKIFGKTIPAGQSCEEDVKSAIDILVNHESAAPFIVKKLIMRLTKSNPKNAYIQRVAKVFQDNGTGKVGDLKAVVKAILLDKDIWDDIKSGNMTKIREPYLTYLHALRVFDVKPLPKFQQYTNSLKPVRHTFNSNGSIFTHQLYNHPKTNYKVFSQAPLMSPTVFNFYSDEFTPNNNEFRLYNHVAPEIEIQTSRVLAEISHKISTIFDNQDRSNSIDIEDESTYLTKSYRYTDKISIDKSSVYNDAIKSIGSIDNLPIYTEPDAQKVYMVVVGAVVDSISQRLLGRKLSDRKREIYIRHFSVPNYVIAKKDNKKQAIYNTIINPILRYILISDDFRVN